MIKQILIKLGYKVTYPYPDCKETFIKAFSTRMGDVLIRLDVWDNELVNLPEAYIHKLPPELQKSMIPHVRIRNGEKYFCYIEKELVTWNPSTPAEVLYIVDKYISETLKKITSISTNWEHEYKGEFVNYWGGGKAYITTQNNTNACYIECHVKTGINNETKECLIFDTDEIKNKWLLSRESWDCTPQQPAVIIDFPNPYIPKNINFPPSTIKEFFEFVKKVDAGTLNKLLQAMLDKLNKTTKFKSEKTINIAIILNTNDGLIGCKVCYLPRIKNAILDSRRRTKKISKFSPILASKPLIKEFTLLNCKNSLEDFVIGRNTTLEGTLQNKKIVIVGAGTIGGYAAQALVQLGAGSGKGAILDVFDCDVLESHNLGRHFLPSKYLGWPKATALCKELRGQFSHQLTLQPYIQFFTKKDLLSKNYDFVIDATGTQPFSRMLRSWRDEIKEPYSAPIIIHGWNAGYGAATRVLIDDGKVCYSCVNSDKEINDRFPVFRKGKKPINIGHSRKCGSVYSAYNSAISLMCAGLIQSAVSRVLSNGKWNFVQHTMDENVQKYKMQTIRPSKVCKCHG